MQSGPKGFYQRLDPWGFVALIFLLALFCYWPALTGGLLWDDPAHVTRLEQQSWEGLVRIWTDARATQQYYPVLHSAFWFEHRLWGDSTLGYHLVNVFQHAMAACLLALVLQRLRNKPFGPEQGALPNVAKATLPVGAEWVAALLFVVHPICVESVAWISEQKNTLSLLLFLAAAFIYLGFASSRRLSSWVLATFIFAVALGTKTATVTLPPSLLVILWWKNGSLNWRKDVLPLVPWFSLSVAAGLTTAWMEKNLIGADGEAFGLTLVERFLLAGRIVWFYLTSQFWPLSHSFFYHLWDVQQEASGWVGYLVGCTVLTVALWRVRQRTRGPLALWLLFTGSLFPVLGFFNVFPFTFSYVADHFQYIATVCFVSGTAIGATCVLNRLPAACRRIGMVAVASLILVFAGISHSLSRNYRNNEALARASIAGTPDNWMAHRILAWTLSKDPAREAEAIHHYEVSLQLNPESPDSLHGLGLLYARSQNTKSEAIRLFQRAIDLRPEFAEAHYALARELQDDPDREDEVIEHCEKALETKPLFAPAHLELANALSRTPARYPEALFHYEEALRINPEYAEAYYKAANLMALHPASLPKAIKYYEEALRLEPDAAIVHFGLANALAQTPGRVVEAIDQYKEALRLNPAFAEAHANLGNALATQPGRMPEALEHFEAALGIDPTMGWVHLTLAMYLTAIPGREADAIRHGETGLRLEPTNLEARNGLAIFYVQQGRFKEARAHWMKALEIDPGYQTARDNLQTLDQIENR